jgi:hypothetical protein
MIVCFIFLMAMCTYTLGMVCARTFLDWAWLSVMVPAAILGKIVSVYTAGRGCGLAVVTTVMTGHLLRMLLPRGRLLATAAGRGVAMLRSGRHLVGFRRSPSVNTLHLIFDSMITIAGKSVNAGAKYAMWRSRAALLQLFLRIFVRRSMTCGICVSQSMRTAPRRTQSYCLARARNISSINMCRSTTSCDRDFRDLMLGPTARGRMRQTHNAAGRSRAHP